MMRFDDLLCGLGLGSVLAEFLMILSCFGETNYRFEFLRLFRANVGVWIRFLSVELKIGLFG